MKTKQSCEQSITDLTKATAQMSEVAHQLEQLCDPNNKCTLLF